jgi:trk system potassium uptake protein TrkA
MRRYKLDKRVLVIGLGVFGQSMVQGLKKENVELIIADQNMNLIERFKNEVDLAVCMDTTDPDALENLNPKDIDVAIVTIGENFECNLLTSVQLKEMGVKKVISRAYKLIQKQILLKSGVDMIITPEEVVAKVLTKDIIDDTAIVESYMKKIIDVEGDSSL